MLLRIRRRNTSSESGDLREFLEAEFLTERRQPDLRLSVYEVVDQDTVRAHTEHFAANHLGPQGRRDFKLDRLFRKMERTLGTSPFALTRNSHRELVFDDWVELEHFALLLMGELEERVVPVEKTEMREYVKARVREEDPEWLTYARTAQRDFAKWIDSASRGLS